MIIECFWSYLWKSNLDCCSRLCYISKRLMFEEKNECFN